MDVVPATGELRELTLRLVLSQPAALLARAHSEGLVDFQDAGEDSLFLARVDDRPVGAVAVSQLPGSVASIWPPVVLGHVEAVGRMSPLKPPPELLEDALLAAALRHAAEHDATLVQCIFEPGDPVGAALLRNGVPFVTELEFRERTLITLPRQTEDCFQDMRLESLPYAPERAAEFAAVLEQTALSSLDCPVLCESRDWSRLLNRQRSPDGFDPGLWRVYQVGGRPAGIMLSNPDRDPGIFEVSYVGIVPEFRGRQLGYHVLLDGLHRMRDCGGVRARLTVDLQNGFARRTYDQLGFSVSFRKFVHGRRAPLLDGI